MEKKTYHVSSMTWHMYFIRELAGYPLKSKRQKGRLKYNKPLIPKPPIPKREGRQGLLKVKNVTNSKSGVVVLGNKRGLSIKFTN